MIITLLRKYEKDHTDGRVFVDGDYFGNSLEDAGRPAGVKINSETCIPEGAYRVSITRSNRFKRDMLILYNISSDHSVDRAGVRFTGIRVHGGNSIENTAGCLIVAKNSDKKGKVWGSQEGELFELVKQSIDQPDPILCVITSDV